MQVWAVIEDPQGSTVRHHWDADRQTWVAKPHRFSSNPWPVNYGYIPGTWNPADEDDLDLMVLSREPLETGSKVRVRVVGLLKRPDADDKILGVLLDDPDVGGITDLNDVPDEAIEAIEKWFAAWSEVGQWRGREHAIDRIERARTRLR